MKKTNISKEDEAQVLIINSTDLIKLFSDDFVKQSTRKDYIEIKLYRNNASGKEKGGEIARNGHRFKRRDSFHSVHRKD